MTTLKTIEEIKSYLLEKSPEWMLEDDWDDLEDVIIERQLTDEHPRAFGINKHFYWGFVFPVYDRSGENKLEEMIVCDTVTREMIDETLLWEETGKLPTWFPKCMDPLAAMDDDVASAEQRVAALEGALVASREVLRRAIEAKTAYLTEREK